MADVRDRNDPAFVRSVVSPASGDMLADLDQRCGRLVLGVLNDPDARRVGELIAARPDVEVAIWAEHGADLDFLGCFPPLVELDVLHCWELADIQGLAAHAQSLTALRLTTGSKRVSVAPLRSLGALRRLYLQDYSGARMKDLDVLEEMCKLEALTLHSVSTGDLGLLGGMQQLKRLAIKLGSVTALDGLRPLDELEYLELWAPRGVTDLEPIAELTNLKQLWLQQLKQVPALPPFTPQAPLRSLYIEGLPKVSALDELMTAVHLEQLFMFNMPHLLPGTFEPLAAHPCLRGATIDLGSDRRNAALSAVLPLPAAEWVWVRSAGGMGLL